MKFQAQQLDVIAMTSATHRAKSMAEDLIQKAARLEADPEREKRVSLGLCRWCHYAGSRIGGAALTTQPCSSCGEDQHYGSTATDALCLPCAKSHGLCKRCGGDRETRTLRRKWPTFCGVP